MRGKMTAYDYYQSLRCLVDSYELRGLPTRYDELNVAIRRYRNLLALKRAGVAHNLHGLDDVREGDLAVENPAAPHPGKNLQENWRALFADKPHLFTYFIALDANFRLKRKDRGSNSDPSLTAGAGYFVEQSLFKRELARIQDVPHVHEKSTCDSSFAALERANTRINRGYSVTGVVAAIDARHGFVLPNAVADLQKGEKYFNSDFVFLSALQRCKVNRIVISYDIACQWKRKLLSRASNFPPQLKEHLLGLTLIPVIPKFHLPAHGFSCQTQYSLNFVPNCARVDGEGIERLWAGTNPVATSTREMTAGTRHDFLEERWSTQNFRKVVHLGESLAAKLRTAVTGLTKHSQELAEFSAANKDHVSKWMRMIEEYHSDPTAHPDPYRVALQGNSNLPM